MTTLLCRITVLPGQDAAFAHMQVEMAASTWQEEDCHIYETFRAAAPNEFYVLMSFSHHPGFIAHQLTPLHLNAPWGELIETVEMIWLDPVEGASTLPPSLPEPVASDDPAQREYLEAYTYRRAGWWPQMAGAPVADPA